MNPGSQGQLVPQLESGTVASTCQLVVKSEGVAADGTQNQLHL